MPTLRLASMFTAFALLAGSATAGITTYGTGCPDSSTAIPALNLTGQSIPGGLVSLSFDSGVPSSSMLVFIGFGQAAIPMGFGCTLNVAPLFPAPLGPLPLDVNGDIAFSTTLLPTLPPAFTITLQGFVIDGALTSGFANSNGVQLVIDAPAAPVGLVINEVDYDQVGTDTTEYVEIYNPTAGAISLTGISLVLVNGATNTTYTTVDLSSGVSVPAGGYLVVANPGLTVAAGAIVINFGAASNTIQNGAPDAIALIDTVAVTLIDALSYEGSVTAAAVTGLGAGINLVEGTAATATDETPFTGSMARFPNGYDSNVASFDWIRSSTPNPGAANVP